MTAMRRNPLMPRKRSCTIFLVFFFLFLAPALLKLSPHTEFLSEALWVGDGLMQALASVGVFTAIVAACSLAGDAYRWLTGRGTAVEESAVPMATPSALEAGTATPSLELAALEVEVGALSTLPSPQSTTETMNAVQSTAAGKLAVMLVGSAFFTYELCVRRQLVAIGGDKPWYEDAGVALLFVFRGFEVLVGLALVLMVGAWVTKKARSAPAAESVEVLFEGELSEDAALVEETVATTEKVVLGG
ncbi:hypothetical protein C8R46DRAFT_1108906 [Mycena filopes]|nr:hypothetical protein C8R46DRAFT_1108906 [Mycena filopes]